MTDSSREQRVFALVAAARLLANPDAPHAASLRQGLSDSTGLSTENVELCLRHHLELNPSSEEVSKLIASAPIAPAVHVVLSANVFVATLRALALAWAASPSVFVRPSSRESLFLKEFLARVPQIPNAEIRLVDSLTPNPQDEIHLYGRNATIRTICQSLPPTQAIRAHGTGLGIAVICRNTDMGQAASSLARDIVPFDQRGCLSPRAVFINLPINEVLEFADFLAVALSAWASTVPVGTPDPQHEAELIRYEDSMRVLGSLMHVGPSAIGILQNSRALALPPVGRHITLVSCQNADFAKSLIQPLSGAITCVGVAGDNQDRFAQEISGLCPGARKTSLGRMQMPPFDGPVDLRQPHAEQASKVLARLQA